MEPCFGTIYSDLSQFRFYHEIAGKVFSMRIDTLGPGHRDPHLKVDMKAWEDCQRCELYHSCYDFSNAKLAMQSAIDAI